MALPDQLKPISERRLTGKTVSAQTASRLTPTWIRVRQDGTRQLLSFLRTRGESQSDWAALLGDLYRRGLKGDKLLLVVPTVAPGWPRPSRPFTRTRCTSAAGCTVDSGSKAVYISCACSTDVYPWLLFSSATCECGSGYHAMFKAHPTVAP